LLCELWRSLVETETLTTSDGVVRLTRALESVDTPQGIREVVGQRLVRLPRATRSLLDLAAVAGQEFSLDTLLRAAARSVTRPESIEPAVHSGLVEETFAPALAYRFTHELVRRAIYDRLGTTRRARLHQRIGETLAAAHPEPSVRVLADLAHHFTAAAPLGGRGRAVNYNVLAAAAATAALAFDDAAALLETALDLTEPDGRQRADVLFELGMARLRAGKAASSLEAFRSAADLARRLGNSELHVRAAIAFGRAAARRPLSVDPREAIELLTEASQALGLDDSPLRVRLLGALARALSLQGDHVDAIAVRTKAIEMAHRIDDRRGLSEALLHASWTAGELSREELANAAGESRRLASEIGDLEIEVEAALLHVSALLALGDTGAARTQLAAAVDMARHARQPFLLLVTQEHVSAVALLEGRLTDAEAAAERSHAWGRQLTSGHSSHSADYGIQMFGIRREQDRLAELAPIARLLASDGRGDGVWQPALAALFAELDMTGAVERELWEISRTGLRPLRTPLWVASLTYLADACSAVAHCDVAALVYPQLEHLSGYPIMVGYSVACYGAADRYLGMLAAVLGDTDQAERHFAAAADLNRRMGAATWLARTLYEHGRMLIGGGEMDRADGLLVEALELADRTELPAVLRRLRSLGESADGAHLPSLRDRLALGVQFGTTKSAGSEG
jgi:tetratricopeptide (TPR) repeat protein